MPFIQGSATRAFNDTNDRMQVGSMSNAQSNADVIFLHSASSPGGSRHGASGKLPVIAGLLALGVAACTPTIQVQAPDKPIEINLNVKIEQEIRIKVDRELDDLFANNPDLF